MSMPKIKVIIVLILAAIIAVGAYFLLMAPDDGKDSGPGPGPGPGPDPDPDPYTGPVMFDLTPGPITGDGKIYVSIGGTESEFLTAIRVEEGTQATFRADADAYAVFFEWTGLPVVTDNPYTLTADGNYVIGAVFIAPSGPEVFTIAPDAITGSGTIFIAIDGTEEEFLTAIQVEEGTEVTFRADATAPAAFSAWTGLPLLTKNPYTLTVDGDYDVGAVFLDPSDPNVYMLSPGTITGTGKIYVSIGGSEEEFLTDVYVEEGTDVTFRAVEVGHVEFSSWDGLPGSANPYLLTVDDNYSIGAVFLDAEPPPAGELSVHFLELGNKYTGDCVYINYGDIDIIIDAGSRTSSSATIIDYVNRYIQDDTIEYVIATHAHQDHIAGFYSTKTTVGVLDAFTIGTIIDYPRKYTTSQTSKDYEATRDRLVAGEGTKHHTALQCYNNEGDAQRVYELGPGVTLEILYQPYYKTSTTNENNYSVCVMVTQDGKQYLFTGDLEKAGEDGLVDYYNANHGGLGHCVLYKGGHHGSSTSSNAKLMGEITPEYVIVCTCMGTGEYPALPENVFPSQSFIDRIAPYTDKVYVTTLIVNYSGNVYTSMNGNVIFSVISGSSTVTITCSGSDKILKESDWFLANRTMPAAWA